MWTEQISTRTGNKSTKSSNWSWWFLNITLQTLFTCTRSPFCVFQLASFFLFNETCPQMRLRESYSFLQNVLANIVSVVAEDVSLFPMPSKPPLYIEPTFSHKYHVVFAALVGLVSFRFMLRCLGFFVWRGCTRVHVRTMLLINQNVPISQHCNHASHHPGDDH